MRKLLILCIGICLALQADAAVTTIQVTIGASATQVSATVNCRWVVFQNNAAHTIRIGDSAVTSSRGVLLAAGSPGGSWQPPAPPPSEAIRLSQYYIAGTQNDVVDVVCDTIDY